MRGLGATLALPLLDSMMPAFTAVAKGAGAAVNRFGVMYVPNGMIMQHWAPIGEGTGFEFNNTMMPLAPFRSQLTVVSGLNCNVPGGVRAYTLGEHMRVLNETVFSALVLGEATADFASRASTSGS